MCFVNTRLSCWRRHSINGTLRSSRFRVTDKNVVNIVNRPWCVIGSDSWWLNGARPCESVVVHHGTAVVSRTRRRRRQTGAWNVAVARGTQWTGQCGQRDLLTTFYSKLLRAVTSLLTPHRSPLCSRDSWSATSVNSAIVGIRPRAHRSISSYAYHGTAVHNSAY